VIFNFSKPDVTDHIYWAVVAAVVSTAVLTFTANGYFTHRVHKLSEGNWWLTAPTALCLVIRLGLAMVTGVEMMRLRSFSSFKEQYGVIETNPVHITAHNQVPYSHC